MGFEEVKREGQLGLVVLHKDIDCLLLHNIYLMEAPDKFIIYC